MRVPARILDDVVAHCRMEIPDEACGLLAAERWDPDVVVAHRTMINYADNPLGTYEMDNAELLAEWAHFDGCNRRVVAIYHSHVLAPPTLSDADVRGAQDPRVLHLVVSLSRLDFQMRLWRVERESPGGPLIRVLGESLDIA